MKARFTALYAGSALATMVLAAPAFAQETTAPPVTEPQPQAPKDTTVESQEVTQGVAQAPEDQGVFSNDIVVTAQKREERLQDVGISVTALSGDALETLHLSNMQQISQQVPSLNVSTWTPAFTIFNLRGISQNNFQDNLEAPVAVYIDDVYLGSMNALGLQMFDMERVEVLRGPQGTLFGRNATGGLIHFLTRDASETQLNGYAEATIADFGTYSAEGAVGGALTSSIRARVAGRWETADGYVKAGFVPDLSGAGGPGHQAQGRTSQGANGFALRGNLQFDLGPETLLSLTGYYSKDHDVPTGQYIVRFARQDDLGLGIDASDPITGSVWRHASDENPFFDRKVRSGTARLTHRFSDAIDLTYVGNYTSLDKFYVEDAGGGLTFFPFVTIADYKQWSQELRLSGDHQGFRWQAGLYYLDMDFNGEFDASGEAITGSPTGRIQGLTDLTSKNWSIFGQAEYEFTPQLTGILGLRWSQDHKKIKFRSIAFGGALGLPDNTVFFDYANEIANNPQFAGDDKIDYGDWAARVQLNYKPNDDLLIFASYNRGIKGGNWSPSPQVFIENFRHKNEVLHAFEIGEKWTFAPGMRLNATAFYYDYKDYQAFSLTALQPQVANSDATAKGGEIELFARPMRNLDLAIGAAFLDSDVDAVPAGDVGEFVHHAEFPQAPGFSLNALARYAFPLTFGELAFQADGRYSGAHFLEGTNSEVSHQDSYAVLNGTVSLTDPDQRWQASLWVKNVTNTKYLVYNLDLSGAFGDRTGFVEQMYAPPRQFGATLRFGF
ncbi:MAG TPA: TonB-dependent receptor [Sphingomicrobium sp.]|nr:TonB-dependent receptor [Sphingomicrobium sp.]